MIATHAPEDIILSGVPLFAQKLLKDITSLLPALILLPHVLLVIFKPSRARQAAQNVYLVGIKIIQMSRAVRFATTECIQTVTRPIVRTVLLEPTEHWELAQVVKQGSIKIYRLQQAVKFVHKAQSLKNLDRHPANHVAKVNTRMKTHASTVPVESMLQIVEDQTVKIAPKDIPR